jgi:hypothetical protein
MAQYGYPGGYGGYGWGGWGSTAQGSIARGLGMFNIGRGQYNYDTAVARSINQDTSMRWNQYVFLSQQEAQKRYNDRRQARMARQNSEFNAIQARLRNNPETHDIEDGDALNALVEELTNPARGSLSLSSITNPLRPELIQDIPFEVATEGMTVCLHAMTETDQWPLALRVDAFKSERDELRNSIIEALEEDKKGTLVPATVERVSKAIKAIGDKFFATVPKTDPDYVPALTMIKSMAGITKMLYSPKIEEVIAELEDYQGTTVGDLLSFMQAFNLRFGPANSYRQKRIYAKLYPMLRDVLNGYTGPAAGTDPAKPGGAASKGFVAGAEDLGGKAVSGMKAAAGDLFKDMDWKYLTPWK